MPRWRLLLLPVIAGVVGYHALDAAFWESVRQGLLVALSVVGAAVLVRLARGMPITNVEFFEVDEIRDLAAAVKKVMRSLRLLIVLTFSVMAGLAVFEPVSKLVIPSATNYGVDVVAIASAVLAAAMTYVFVRIIDVVRGDYDLVDLQAALMVRSVERRAAKKFEDRHVSDQRSPKFQSPEGYGKVLQ
jgi:hypothetical protein